MLQLGTKMTNWSRYKEKKVPFTQFYNSVSDGQVSLQAVGKRYFVLHSLLGDEVRL